MKIANIEQYLPKECTEIVSGGAKGIDTCVADYAKRKGVPLTEILPRYERYGRAAPIKRNKEIVDCSDEVVAFWDGKSRGTAFVIAYCKKKEKPCSVVLLSK